MERTRYNTEVRSDGIGESVCKVSLCAVGVGKEGLAQLSQCAGFIVAVGVCAVLQGMGNGGFSLIDLHGKDGAELCG